MSMLPARHRMGGAAVAAAGSRGMGEAPTGLTSVGDETALPGRFTAPAGTMVTAPASRAEACDSGWLCQAMPPACATAETGSDTTGAGIDKTADRETATGDPLAVET